MSCPGPRSRRRYFASGSAGQELMQRPDLISSHDISFIHIAHSSSGLTQLVSQDMAEGDISQLLIFSQAALQSGFRGQQFMR